VVNGRRQEITELPKLQLLLRTSNRQDDKPSNASLTFCEREVSSFYDLQFLIRIESAKFTSKCKAMQVGVSALSS
jgi:hypothetical protein